MELTREDWRKAVDLAERKIRLTRKGPEYMNLLLPDTLRQALMARAFSQP